MFKKAALLTLVFLFVFSFAYARERIVKENLQVQTFKLADNEQNDTVAKERPKISDAPRTIQGVTSWMWELNTSAGFPPPGFGITGPHCRWGFTTNNPRRGNGCIWCAEDHCGRNAGVDPYGPLTNTALEAPWFPLENLATGLKLELYVDLDFDDPGDRFEVDLGLIDAIGGWHWAHITWAGPRHTGGYARVALDFKAIFGENWVKNAQWGTFDIEFWTDNDWNIGGGAWVDDVKLMCYYYDQTVALYEAMPLAGKAPLEVQFMNMSNGTPNHFLWNYGDGVSEEIRDARPYDVHPYHTYDVGMYDVNMRAWVPVSDPIGGNDFDLADELLIPYLIYADPELDYIPMTLLSGGDTWPGETWEDVIDHDVWGANCKVAALPDQSEATFQLSTLWDVQKIRIMVDNAEVHDCQTNFAKTVKVTLSLDAVFDGADPSVTVDCPRLNGEWNCLDFAPIKAQYAKVDIVEARGGRYHEMVEIQLMGTEATLAKEMPKSAIGAPTSFALAQNSPNPFNPTTDIRFELPEEAEVQLSIYNIQGQLVRTLASGKYNSGFHTLTWDAMDLNGLPVAGGVYVYKLQATGAEKTAFFTKKMILMK